MMFPHSKHVQTDLIGEFDPLNQLADTLRRTGVNALALVSELRGETVNAVNADLHLLVLLLRVRHSLLGLTSLVRFQ